MGGDENEVLLVIRRRGGTLAEGGQGRGRAPARRAHRGGAGVSVPVRSARLPHGADLPLPAYETAGAAGMDLRAAIRRRALVLHPGERAAVPTGLAIALPAGFEAQVRPRSGLALATGHPRSTPRAPSTATIAAR